MALEMVDINDRWRTTGLPHADTGDEGASWFAACPSCPDFKGESYAEIFAAMNEALGHKQAHHAG